MFNKIFSGHNKIRGEAASEFLPPVATGLSRPPNFPVLIETCIACMYSNQNIDETATLLRFRNTIYQLLYWQMTSTGHFGLDYRKKACVLSSPGPLS